MTPSGSKLGLGATAAVLFCLACGSPSPTSPSGSANGSHPPGFPDREAGASSASPPGEGTATLNAVPVLKLKTTPVARPGDPYPVITGTAPFTVRFNLCESSDSDQVIRPDGTQDPSGDSLNWQFHFGDEGTPPFDEDGSFDPSFDHFCRTEHTYESGGTFVATVSVTDKHLEDQAHEVTSAARATERVTIEVAGGSGTAAAAPPFVALSNLGAAHVGTSCISGAAARASGFTTDGGGPYGLVSVTATLLDVTGTVTMALYSDGGGQPGAALSPIATVPLGGTAVDVDYTFQPGSPIPLANATTYWLVTQTTVSTCNIALAAGGQEPTGLFTRAGDRVTLDLATSIWTFAAQAPIFAVTVQP